MRQVRFFTNRTWRQTRFAAGERGVAMVEYAVLIALIAGIGIPVIGFVGTNVLDQFDQAAEQLCDHGNQGDHGINDGDQEAGNHDPGNQGNGNGGSQGNGYANGPCANQGDHGNNDGDQEAGNHDPGNQGNGNGNGNP